LRRGRDRGGGPRAHRPVRVGLGVALLRLDDLAASPVGRRPCARAAGRCSHRNGAATGTAFGLGPLFLFFLKVGSVLFGSGYVLLAFLRADLVTRWGWLTEGQLIDAVAVGQVTPGPLFTTATFHRVPARRLSGGLVATVGIFLPAFVFVAASGPLVPRLRRSRLVGAFLDGINVASLALMAVSPGSSAGRARRLLDGGARADQRARADSVSGELDVARARRSAVGILTHL